MKKPLVLVVSIVVVFLVIAFVRSEVEARRARALREAAYQTELGHFRHDLRLGVHRSEVKSYLDARRVAYSEINWDFDVEIGQEPSRSIFCERWDVYVEMAFTRLTGQTGASPFDNLDSISIRKIGTCL